MKRGRLAIAAATVVVVAAALAGTDGPRASAPAADTSVASATASSGSQMASPIWRIDVPKLGGPFTARLSPNARLVAVEAANARTGVVIHEIQQPVPPSNVALLRELVRLDRVAGLVQWLPDSSGLLAYEPDYPSAPTGALSLVGTSGKRWSVATRGEVGHSARFSPDGRFVALTLNPPGALVIALDGGASYPMPGDDTRHFAGWDNEGNLLFRLKDANTLEARALDARVVYTVAVPDDLREFGATVPTFQQPRDAQILTFHRGGCCKTTSYAHRVLFDRKLHEFPDGLEPLLMEIGDGPWRGREVMTRRESDAELIAFDPRVAATRVLGAKLPDAQVRWGFSGDYLAWGRNLVQLSTGRAEEWTVQPPPESIYALDSGRFVLWRDGTTELLDASAWFASPRGWNGELPLASDQRGVPADWVRVRDDDGGFTLARPRSWSSYEGAARGATLASGSGGDMRVEIRLDIVGPRGPADFLDGLGHHGGRVTERRSVQLTAGVAEFAVVYDNTLYPKPATTLNWALRSPYLPERVVWIRAWPLDSGRRAEVEAIVATLEFVAPR